MKIIFIFISYNQKPKKRRMNTIYGILAELGSIESLELDDSIDSHLDTHEKQLDLTKVLPEQVWPDILTNNTSYNSQSIFESNDHLQNSFLDVEKHRSNSTFQIKIGFTFYELSEGDDRVKIDPIPLPEKTLEQLKTYYQNYEDINDSISNDIDGNSDYYGDQTFWLDVEVNMRGTIYPRIKLLEYEIMSNHVVLTYDMVVDESNHEWYDYTAGSVYDFYKDDDDVTVKVVYEDDGSVATFLNPKIILLNTSVEIDGV